MLSAARQMPSGVRAEARSDARSIVLSAFALSLGIFLVFHGFRHSTGRPPWFLATSLAAWAAVATLSANGAWRWGGSFDAGSTLQLVTIAVGTPALLMAISLALGRLSPAAASLGAGAAVDGLPCLALTFGPAILPLAGLCVLRRSTNPLHPIAGGAALGAASGAAAGVMVDLWCPVTTVAHVLSAHVLPVVALSVIGAILGDHVLAMRVSAAVSAARAPSPHWKEAVIAKPFVSCDVHPVGDCAAGSRTRSVGVGGGEGAGAGWHHDP